MGIPGTQAVVLLALFSITFSYRIRVTSKGLRNLLPFSGFALMQMANIFTADCKRVDVGLVDQAIMLATTDDDNSTDGQSPMTLEECDEWQRTAWQIQDSDARTKLDNIRKSKACDRLRALEEKRRTAARERKKRLAEALQANELLKATKVQKHLAETLEVEVALSRVVETEAEEDHHQAQAENTRLENKEIQRVAELAAEAQRLAHQGEVDRIVQQLQQDIADAAEEARQRLIAKELAAKKQKLDEYAEACAMYPPLVFKEDPLITSLDHMISEIDSMRRKCNGFMDDKGIQVRGDDDLLTKAYKSHMRSWWDFCRKCEEVCCQSVEHCVRDMRIFKGSEANDVICDMGLKGKRGEDCIAMCVERF